MSDVSGFRESGYQICAGVAFANCIVIFFVLPACRQSDGDGGDSICNRRIWQRAVPDHLRRGHRRGVPPARRRLRSIRRRRLRIVRQR